MRRLIQLGMKYEHSISQSIKVFLGWPKWHCHCKVHCRCKCVTMNPKSVNVVTLEFDHSPWELFSYFRKKIADIT